MSEAAPDRFETVAYIYSRSDLALLQSLFESEAIKLVAIGSGHASVELGLTTALGGVAVRVHAEDIEDARAVLASLDPVPYRASLFTGLFAFDLLVLVMLFLFGIPPPPRQAPCFLLHGTTAERRVATRDRLE